MNNLSKCRRFVDIGCGAGYFTNGIALKHEVEVLGIDIDPSMVAQAEKIRKYNELSSASHILVDHTVDYNDLIHEDDLVLVDTEGAEYKYLNPEISPNLTLANFIIEIDEDDEFDQLSGKQEFIRRFSKTHTHRTLRQVLNLDYDVEVFKKFPWLSNFAYHISCFEYRRVPQDWLILERKLKV